MRHLIKAVEIIKERYKGEIYEIRRAGYYGDKFMIMEMHEGWGIGVGTTYDTKEEAEQFIKEYTK